MQTVQTPQNRAQLACRPTASLGRASGGGERGVDCVDLHQAEAENPAANAAMNPIRNADSAPSLDLTHIDGEINRPIANGTANLLNDSHRTCVMNMR